MSTPHYDVLLRMRVHSCFAGSSSSDINLERRVTLPCPPYDGLSIAFNDDEEIKIQGDERSGTTTRDRAEIYWDVQAGLFVVYLSDKTIYWAELHKQPHEKVEDIAAEYVAAGWTREVRSWEKGGDAVESPK